MLQHATLSENNLLDRHDRDGEQTSAGGHRNRAASNSLVVSRHEYQKISIQGSEGNIFKDARLTACFVFRAMSGGFS